MPSIPRMWSYMGLGLSPTGQQPKPGTYGGIVNLINRLPSVNLTRGRQGPNPSATHVSNPKNRTGTN